MAVAALASRDVVATLLRKHLKNFLLGCDFANANNPMLFQPQAPLRERVELANEWVRFFLIRNEVASDTLLSVMKKQPLVVGDELVMLFLAGWFQPSVLHKEVHRVADRVIVRLVKGCESFSVREEVSVLIAFGECSRFVVDGEREAVMPKMETCIALQWLVVGISSLPSWHLAPSIGDAGRLNPRRS